MEQMLSGGAPEARDARVSRSAVQADGVAVMGLYGTIMPRGNLWTQLGIGTALDAWGRELRALADDQSVKAIVLDVNSPGGSVYGLLEAAEDMAYARERKPVVAVANPLMASAAYWIGSQATEVVSTPSGESGNIGVIYVHATYARALEEDGVDVTVFTAGDFKGEGHPALPLDDEARDAIQAQVDRMYGDFVRAVADGRGVSPQAVKTGMGRGRILSAQEAKSERVIDRVERLSSVVARVQRGQARGALQRRRAATNEEVADAVWRSLKERA